MLAATNSSMKFAIDAGLVTPRAEDEFGAAIDDLRQARFGHRPTGERDEQPWDGDVWDERLIENLRRAEPRVLGTCRWIPTFQLNRRL